MKKFSLLILFILLFNLTYSKVYARDEAVFTGVEAGLRQAQVPLLQ